MPSFSDLPVELCEAIILHAAQNFVYDDRATLTSLALASRRIRSLVVPILQRCVVLSTSNIACITQNGLTSAAFPFTRYLFIQYPFNNWALSQYTQAKDAFVNITDFAGPTCAFRTAVASAKLSVLVVTTVLPLNLLLAPEQPQRLSALTHLRVRVIPWHRRPLPYPDLPCLEQVMFDLDLSGAHLHQWRAAPFISMYSPGFLSLPCLVRFLIRVAPWAVEAHREIHSLACELRDSRLWIDIAPVEDAAYEPQTVFDRSNWNLGQPLYVP